MSFPCAYNDIRCKLLFSYKKAEDTYVICSIKGDAQYYCKKKFVDIILDVFKYFDGTHSVDEIKDIIAKKYPCYKVDKVIDKLADSKFIIGNNNSNLSNELELNSLNLVKLDISFISKINKHIIDFFYYLFSFSFVVAVFIFIFLLFKGEITFSNYIQYANRNSYGKEFLIVLIAGIPSMVLHEISHILTAQHYGYSPKHLGFSLHFYFIPMYYVITPGMYLLDRSKRMHYHLSGVMANFVLFAVFNLIAYFTKDSIYYVLAFSNLQVVIFNLMPFNLTDGYFVMCLIFKKINLRLQFIELLSFRKNLKNQSFSIKIYALIAFIYMVILSFNLSFWLKGFISEMFGFEITHKYLFDTVVAAMSLVFFIVSINIRARKKPKNH